MVFLVFFFKGSPLLIFFQIQPLTNLTCGVLGVFGVFVGAEYSVVVFFGGLFSFGYFFSG